MVTPETVQREAKRRESENYCSRTFLKRRADPEKLDRRAFTEGDLTEGIEGLQLSVPCRFLNEDGSCVIHECMPEECLGFPYTDQQDRIYSILSFAEVCPVVFEMLERLKDWYRFRR